MLRNSLILFSVLVLTIGVWIGPKSSLLLLIDFGLAILNRLDGVEQFNTKQPNYVDGNWAPTHQELDQIKMTGNGFIPENLIGKEVYAASMRNLKTHNKENYSNVLTIDFGIIQQNHNNLV